MSNAMNTRSTTGTTNTNTTTSSIPTNPTLRSSCLNTVAVVPLLSPRQSSSSSYASPFAPPTFSEQSFDTLFAALASFTNLDRGHDDASVHSNLTSNASNLEAASVTGTANVTTSKTHKDRTLVIPNSQLTPPGGWRFESTPLKSHNWSMGCQRMLLMDGREGCKGSALAKIRLESFQAQAQAPPSSNEEPQHKHEEEDKEEHGSDYGKFVDLYPSRGVSAVVGVLNVNDCKSIADVHRAEEELALWTRRYAAPLHKDQQDTGTTKDTKDTNTQDPSIIAPQNFCISRLFVFDSFETLDILDLTQTKSQRSGALVAFPPIENMDLHLNVVVNDLAVAIFSAMEKRISVLDDLNSKVALKGVGGRRNENRGFRYGGGGGGSISASQKRPDQTDISTLAGIVGPGNLLGDSTHTVSSSTNGGGGTGGTGGTLSDETATTTTEQPPPLSNSFKPHPAPNSGGPRIPGTRLKNFAVSAVKGALHNKSYAGGTDDDSYRYQKSIHDPNTLCTPMDEPSFDPAQLTSKDVECIVKRNAARREKYTADLALLAGSPLDAYERYTRAAEAAKLAHDPLWYAASLEGVATSFVAMSDTGGHGADLYLENNFQYPKEIMKLALDVTNANSEDGKESKVDNKKTTMSSAVIALLEDACAFFSKDVRLASIYTELLLKMAWYVAELEELHLRCRWGEGFSGGEGQSDADGHSMTAAISGQQKRWENTSVAKIDLDALRKKGKLGPLLSVGSVAQCRRFTEFLHQAVSNSGLDSYTRAFAATRCAKLCLRGVKIPLWDESDFLDSNPFKRIFLPRKAAFFTVVAAEAMTQSRATEASSRAGSLWAAASHLYSKEANAFHEDRSYAWSTLRATVLHGLSLRGDSASSEMATEILLMLLSDISPRSERKTGKERKVKRKGNDKNRLEPDGSTKAFPEVEKPQQQILRKSSSTTRNFHVQTSSVVLLSRSKWIDGDRIPLLQLPLIDATSMIKNIRDDRKLNSSLKEIYERSQRCISHLFDVRRTIPTSSTSMVMLDGIPNKNQYREKFFPSIPSALEIRSAKIIKSDDHLLLDRTKAAGFSTKPEGSIATFFNPYDKIKKDDKIGRNIITLVAQGEERTIEIEFGNHLNVPLKIPSCRLEFDKNEHIEIEAPSLSFVIPPKASKFVVHFPFVVVSSNVPDGNIGTVEDDTDQAKITFAVVGLRIVTFNRGYTIRFDDNITNPETIIAKDQVPMPVSTYRRSIHNVPKRANICPVTLESVPAQPNLLVSFSNSPTPLDDSVTVPVHLSDGEIYKIPSFRLENDLGLGGRGKMKRLQIVGVGLPGLAEEVLFDTDLLAKALEEQEEIYSETDSNSSQTFEDLMESDGLPPLRMKCLANDISLESINDNSRCVGEGSTVTLQIAATHDMGNQLANGGKVRIRFRYRGPSSEAGIEIWRKREIALHIVRMKGPRISSLTYRPDLSWGSAYSDLCRSLAFQRMQMEEVPNWETSKMAKVETLEDKERRPLEELAFLSNDEGIGERSVLLNIGLGEGIFVSRDDTVVLMAVANETDSTIVLSNRSGVVGGFASCPMPTVRVTSGVSVKIPVVIPRIDYMDETGEAVDIASELIARTALQWESDNTNSKDPGSKRWRQGRVRIPSRCLREIIENHSTFHSRICKPPINIQLTVGGDSSDSIIVIPTGAALDLKAIARFQEWVDSDVRNSRNVTIEFCCARKDSGKSMNIFRDENNGAYIWCGQLRKTLATNTEELQHNARILFVEGGDYILSVCAKIFNSQGGETWWAPNVVRIKVKKGEH